MTQEGITSSWKDKKRKIRLVKCPFCFFFSPFRILLELYGLQKAMLERIRNADIRKTAEVANVSDKVREYSLWWLGHVVTRDEIHLIWRVWDLGEKIKKHLLKFSKSYTIEDMSWTLARDVVSYRYRTDCVVLKWTMAYDLDPERK